MVLKKCDLCRRVVELTPGDGPLNDQGEFANHCEECEELCDGIRDSAHREMHEVWGRHVKANVEILQLLLFLKNNKSEALAEVLGQQGTFLLDTALSEVGK